MMEKFIKRLLSLIFLVVVFILSPEGIKAQEQSVAELRQKIEQARCFVAALRPYEDINLQVWAVARTGNDRANRGIEPTRIEHPCGANQPQYAFYTHQQVVSNLRIATDAISRMESKLAGMGGAGAAGSGVGSGSAAGAANPELVGNRPTWQNAAEGVKVQERAEGIARQYAAQAKEIGTISNTANPDGFIREFNRRIQDLENLNRSFNEERWTTALQGVQDIQSAVNTGNEADFYRGIGAAAGLFDMFEARKEAKAQEARLYEQRRNQMSQYYWDALDRTDEQIQEFEMMAGYAESQELEAYYLAMTENLKCFKESMEENWTASNTDWLRNTCKVPERPREPMVNNLISREQYYSDLAERKYRYYLGNMTTGLGFEGESITETWGDRFRTTENKYYKVTHIVSGSPAARSALKEGDRINSYMHTNFPEELEDIPGRGWLEAQIEILRDSVKAGLVQQSEISSKASVLTQNAILRMSNYVRNDFNNLEQDLDDSRFFKFIIGNPKEDGGIDRKQVTLKKSSYPINGGGQFLDAAISFASEAAIRNPSAENYYRVARYSDEKSSVLAMVNLLTAFSVDPDFFSGQSELYYYYLTGQVQEQIKEAIEKGDTDFIDSFVKGGLNEYIRINNEDIFLYAIELDQPIMVQRILNQYLDGADDSKRQSLVQAAVLASAERDSEATMKRLIELGVNTEFTVDGQSPLSVARENNSTQVLSLLN